MMEKYSLTFHGRCEVADGAQLDTAIVSKVLGEQLLVWEEQRKSETMRWVKLGR